MATDGIEVEIKDEHHNAETLLSARVARKRGGLRASLRRFGMDVALGPRVDALCSSFLSSSECLDVCRLIPPPTSYTAV